MKKRISLVALPILFFTFGSTFITGCSPERTESNIAEIQPVSGYYYLLNEKENEAYIIIDSENKTIRYEGFDTYEVIDALMPYMLDTEYKKSAAEALKKKLGKDLPYTVEKFGATYTIDTLSFEYTANEEFSFTGFVPITVESETELSLAGKLYIWSSENKR